MPFDLDLVLEAGELTPEGVPFRGDVDQAEVVTVGDDHPGAGPEHRPAGLVVGPDRLGQTGGFDPHHDRGALAAGEDQSVEVLEIVRQPDLDRLRPDRAQVFDMALRNRPERRGRRS